MEGKEEDPPFIRAIPAVESKCIPKLSKELKKYKSPVKRITSFYATSKSNVKARAVLNQTPEFQSHGGQTLHLPSPLLDVKNSPSNLADLEMFDFRMSINKESVAVFSEKNAREEKKKVNGIREESLNEANPDKIKTQGGRKDIAFEFTDSEDDESNISGNRDTVILLYYSCKHCQYSDVNVDNVSSHYQNDHPYVVYNQVYIQDPSDLSATFRCLTCPVEFLTLSDLKAHTTENHPLSPNLFTIQSSDLSFKCFVCAFTCSALEEVKAHYKEKHPTHDVASSLTFCRYWVDTRQEEQPQLNDSVTTPVSEMPQQRSPNTSPTSAKDAFQIVPSNQNPSPASQNTTPACCLTTEQKSSAKTNDHYQYPEKLFYCQICNYANVTAKGVLNHQIGIHGNACMEDVLEHTKKICDELKHLRSQAKDSSFTSRLPLPLLEQGGEDMLFCHLCNYRNKKMKVILRHYLDKHDKWKIECDQVQKHSSIVHRQIEDLRPQETSGQKISPALNEGKKLTRKRSEKLSKGSVDSQQKKEEAERRTDPDDTDGRPPSPRTEQEETRPLTCKASDGLQHYPTAHPWSVKKDGSVLCPITRRQSRTRKWLEVENEIPPFFESYQVPLEFENTPTMAESPKKIQCTFCPETFPPQRRVDAHCDKSHRDGVMDNSDAQIGEPSTTSSAHPDKVDSSLHVFKCPYCSYVSSTLVGIFIHSSVIHPNLVITKEICLLQMVNMLDFEKFAKRKGSSLILSGYMCKNCPQIYASLQMLRTHRQVVHCETTAEPQPEPQTSTLDKEKPCDSKPKSQSTAATKGSVHQQGKSEVDESSSSPGTVLVYQCPECPYVNLTDYGFLMHCQKKHPSLLVRAEEFHKEKTSIANFEHLNKRFKSGGYKCKKCLCIFYTAIELNTHVKRQKCSYKVNTSALVKAEENPKLSSLSQKDDSLHRCRLCPYKGLYRRYLFDHYKKKHKLSLTARRKLLESSARDKSSRAAAAKKSHLESKARPHTETESTQQLVSHSRTVPLSVGALDFIVLAKPSEEATGLYRCSHCSEQVRGTKTLSSHLDKHRDLAKKAAVVPGDDVTAPLRDEPPVLDTIQDLAPVATLDVPQRPPSSPSNPPTLEKTEPVEEETSFACKHCSRVFKFQKGLASHERSHATVAALRKQTTDSTSTLKHSINKYILCKAGNRRPFICTLCRYSTTIVSLLRRHLLKKHESIVRCLDVTDSQGSDQSTVSKVASPTKMVQDPPEHPEDLQTLEGLSYSEAPEVQRQLDHYNKMAQASDTSEANVLKEASAAASLLRCELCSYRARCLPTLRKHYSTRHGRRTLTCKDCPFVTSSKKWLKKHIEMGHDSSGRLPALLDALSCPFCLYRTRNKNYMIDHIVLHREERVVPIEPCRPHLSRYLQGIVLRCHKCTFTSGSAESLRLHMTKHDDVKPYKCQLCYFDCAQQSDLEAHLSDKHQVLRNHELVGQIRLDELEARLDRTTPDEGHTVPDTTTTDCRNLSVGTRMKTVAGINIQHLQDKNTSQSPNSEQEDPQQARCLSDTGAGKETEVTAGEAEQSDSQTERKDIEIQENQTQLQPENGDQDDVRKSGLKEKIVQLIDSSDKRPRMERMFNDAKIEEKILRCVVQLEKDDCAVTKRRKSELDRPAKEERTMESVFAHSPLLFSKTSIMDPTRLDGVRSPSHFTFRRHSLTPGVLHNARRRLSSGGVRFKVCRDEQIENPGGSEEAEVAEEGHRLSCCKERDQADVDEATHRRKRPRREDEGARTRAESPHTSEGAHTTSFACNLCGRKLVNSCQLERHVEQHGK